MVHTPMLISVVVPSFNQAAFIGDALSSITSQTHQPIETIVVDGGSTDGAVDVIRRVESLLAHWESAPDRGQTDALIKGFARTTGDIQCWLNSDDRFTAGALAEFAAFFDANPHVDVVFGDSEW